jgi:NAD(P)-dependent dehydrogenase (short-subunit alcohol dehydrogenase family)
MLKDKALSLGLHGKVALVTGGASGIGRAVALAFASAGAMVAVADIDEAGGEKLLNEIKDQRGDFLFFPCDVTQLEQCEKTVDKTWQAFNGLDILVNAAGMILRATVVETDEADWDRILNVNLKGTFLMCKFALPRIAQSGGGAVVNISSGWGLVGGRRAAAYCASKGGIVLLTKAMALDHAGQNIRVNCVCPGDTDTPMLREEARQIGKSIDMFLKEAADRPLGRLGTPEEVAGAVLFLASESAAFITGTTLVVDGGGLAGTL